MLWHLIGLIIGFNFGMSAAYATSSYTAHSFCDAFEREARASGQCRELLASGISNRRVKLESQAATLCLKQMRDSQSEQRSTSKLKISLPQTCNEAIVGQQKSGQKCDSAFECAAGLVCIGDRGGPPGSCRSPLPAYANCDDSQLNSSQLHNLIAASRSVCGANAHCGQKNQVLVCLPH